MTTTALLNSMSDESVDVVPRDRLAHITPNWFTTVMGTGIVATAAATRPAHVTGLHTVATVVWILASVALLLVSSAFAAHWLMHRENARGYLNHAMVSHFYGAPAMAALTVGAGTLLFGKDLIGVDAAVWIDAVLWTIGTAIGVVAVGFVAVRLLTRADRGGEALPARMMSVVAPMVSASTGALLVPHIADADMRTVFLVLCYAMFLLSFVFGTATTFFVYRRMIRVGLPARAAVPTVWIPLGMIGQSITAAITLGTASRGEFTGTHAYVATGLHTAGMYYGIVVGIIGVVAFTLSVTITARAAYTGLPFSLTWWSFTFPVGTCVTGATALGTATGIGAIHDVAIVLYVLLFCAWAVVAARTVAAIRSGALPAAA
ncbi:TDT family transporter [Williamsia phyllosphaerae]|uniref:C4-dicarboxylate ABC transporter n=1 Tax=Williamsia phyllosphaerae TaxID=885042 RepID=A0ABQ1UHH1_9NOCA|nr:TDT family transporter [Williamsia phyllosphaerae]GGF19136.1 C4-dicarboxylate ABC transporter [Williamsia phyllosphaerae]